MSIFEAGMLICFGAAWPFSVYKSYKSESTGGKSMLFLFVVFIGYVFGIIHKVFYNLDYVIILYIINAILVFTDILIYIRNMKIEKLPIKEEKL